MTKISDITSGALKTAENAAIACYDWIGKGKEKLADAAAVDSMRNSLNKMSISGTVVIGEGERDEAPMLYIGEEVGTGGLELDIALDPLEGTTICATANSNSLAVIAFAQKGNLLNAPDVYMDIFTIGPNLPNGIIDLDNSPKANLKNLAQAKKCDISDLTAIILERPRHEELIAKSREAGARVQLISDGDIAAAIATTDPKKTGIDIYMGTGGAPEGVLAATALKVSGSQMLGRLIFNDNKKQIERAKNMGITDLNKKYLINEIAKGDTLFIASGVTDGSMLPGVVRNNNYDMVSSIIMDSAQKSIKIINSKYLK